MVFMLYSRVFDLSDLLQILYLTVFYVDTGSGGYRGGGRGGNCPPPPTGLPSNVAGF